MGRMSLPPSRRRKREDWKERIAIIARDILDMERSGRPLRGPSALRAAAIGQFRYALDPEVADASMETVIDGQPMVMPCIAVRIVLGEEGFDWRSPSAAESVMVVAERAVDDALQVDRDACNNIGINKQTGRPWTWQERIEYLAGMFVAFHRHSNPDEGPSLIRSSILADFREALGEASSASMYQKVAVTPQGGGPPRDEECMSQPGAFRMVLGTEDRDWHQPENAEEAMRVASAALDASLAA